LVMDREFAEQARMLAKVAIRNLHDIWLLAQSRDIKYERTDELMRDIGLAIGSIDYEIVRRIEECHPDLADRT
ncbi:hypothetical protein ABTB97_21690, partial [Acinetobacter baumannii]